jgi:hypothetical protein
MEMCAAELKQASAACVGFYGLSAVVSMQWKMFVACVSIQWGCLSCYRYVSKKCEAEGFSCPVFGYEK